VTAQIEGLVETAHTHWAPDALFDEAHLSGTAAGRYRSQQRFAESTMVSSSASRDRTWSIRRPFDPQA
jgi:hypothetical protein